MGSSKLCANVTDIKFLDGEEHSVCSNCVRNVSCTTFNILAPIYKCLDTGSRESEVREIWLSRNKRILDRLLHLKSSIICLQELWMGNDELVGMYDGRLKDAGYEIYILARTNNRGDGLLTAVQKNHFQVLNYKEVLFNDFGDRVAQLLHIKLVMHCYQNQNINVGKEVLLVNTHLLFPHNSGYCLSRLQEVYKILKYIQSYHEEYKLAPVPILLCGDLNGSKSGHVYKFLRSQGFVSSYDVAHNYADSEADAHKWVSHRNHRGDVCGVDFIWLHNPNNHRKPLKESFIEAVLGNIKNHLDEATYQLNPKTDLNDRSFIIHSQFYEALSQFGLSCNSLDGLSTEEIKDLWDYVDMDKDGVIEFAQFNHTTQRGSESPPFLQQREKNSKDTEVQAETLRDNSKISTTVGFDIKNAVFFPPEVEEGIWPGNYSLSESDHAQLTVEFAPVMIHCS